MPTKDHGQASANAVLRDYFYERYWELFGVRAAVRGFVTPGDAYRENSDPFAEQFVDIQVETYLSEMEDKLRRMKRGVFALQSVRREALARDSVSRDALKQRFKTLAAQVEDNAGDLHDMVSAVVDLSEKNQARLEKTAYAQDFFGAELDYLTTQVGRAEGDLKDMFLEPSNVVTVDELRGENVLTELRSIERVSKGIRQGR